MEEIPNSTFLMEYGDNEENNGYIKNMNFLEDKLKQIEGSGNEARLVFTGKQCFRLRVISSDFRVQYEAIKELRESLNFWYKYAMELRKALKAMEKDS